MGVVVWVPILLSGLGFLEDYISHNAIQIVHRLNYMVHLGSHMPGCIMGGVVCPGSLSPRGEWLLNDKCHKAIHHYGKMLFNVELD